MTARGIAPYLLVTIAAVWLAAELPPHGFYSGDSGVKLIAARNAIAHPSRPFEIDLPNINGRAVPYVERFFTVHGQHAHALQSPLFPVLSAPFIALFGLRGAYILPLASFVALLRLLLQIARHAAPGVSVWIVALAGIFAGPVLFYAFEFWEHVPAIVCLAGATALVFTAHPSRAQLLGSGALSATAILLRPEALWYVAALACRQIYVRARVADYAGAVVSILGVFAVFNVLESGTWLGLHASANMAPLLDDWARVRVERGALWFWPDSMLWTAGILVLLASWAAFFLTASPRFSQATGLSAAAMLALDAATGAYPRESLWSCWPIGLILLVPSTRIKDNAAMWWLTVFTIVAVWLSSTHDGGAQWGPRFVLIAAPAMIVLAAANVGDATGPGQARRFRQALVLIMLLAGLWTTRAAYRELRGTKQFYAQLVDAVDRSVETGRVIIFSTWWFDQVVASLYSAHTFLYADGTPAAAAILKELQAVDIRHAAIAWSHEEPEDDVVGQVVAQSCYEITHTDDIPQRQVTILTVRCRAPEPRPASLRLKP